MEAFAAAAPPSRWRATPGRLASLILGLALFGAGEALIIASELGNSPWTVLAEGLGEQAGTSVGLATVAVSAVVLTIWFPLRQRPGLGTVLNAVLVGVFIDLTLHLVPSTDVIAVRAAEVPAGIALVALGSAFYLGARLGPGPRDGLMTGLHRRTGFPVGAIRAAIEIVALTGGWLLGGTVGLGTLAFAVFIGPAVALGLKVRNDPEVARQ